MRNTSGTNVRGWLALVLPALLPVAAWADPLVLEAPTEVPATATTPVQNPPADPALANGRILLFPFQPDNPADANAWMGKSIQESLVADLTVMAPARVAASDQLAATLDGNLALAKQRGARFIIVGGFASSTGELRITGQVVDVETGKPVGALKVTGEPSQIFHMEDGLAMQIKAQIMPGQDPAGPQAQPQPQPQVQQPQQLPYPMQTPAATESTGVRTDYPTQTPIYSTYATPPNAPVYGADTSYPYTGDAAAYPYVYPAYTPAPYCDYGYPYCYPYYGVGVGFYGGFFGSHFNNFHGRNFNSRGFISNHSFNGVRSSSGIRSGSSFRSAAPFRSSSISARSSFSHSSSLGGFHGSASFHSSGGSFHSSGGGSFHGGGSSHGGGGGHGGHR